MAIDRLIDEAVRRCEYPPAAWRAVMDDPFNWSAAFNNVRDQYRLVKRESACPRCGRGFKSALAESR